MNMFDIKNDNCILSFYLMQISSNAFMKENKEICKFEINNNERKRKPTNKGRV